MPFRFGFEDFYEGFEIINLTKIFFSLFFKLFEIMYRKYQKASCIICSDNIRFSLIHI